MDDTSEPDPYEHLTSRYDWIRTIRRTRFGPRSRTKEIALLVASYGNTDGTRCFAGVRRLAAVAECDEKTVKRSLEKLRSLGLITLVESGSHHGRPRKGDKARNDKYILTVPPDIADRIAMLPPDELDPDREMELQRERRVETARRREMRRIEREAAKGSSKGSVEGSANSRETPADPVADPGYQGTVAAYQGTVRPVSGDSSTGIRGHLRSGIPAMTCEDDPDQTIGPRHRRPGHMDDHPASVKRASAGALAARDGERQDMSQDKRTDLDADFQMIAHEVGDDLTDGEASKVRGLLGRGVPPQQIINVVRLTRDLSAA